MIGTASKRQPFARRQDDGAAHHAHAPSLGVRPVFPGWGPKIA